MKTKTPLIAVGLITLLATCSSSKIVLSKQEKSLDSILTQVPNKKENPTERYIREHDKDSIWAADIKELYKEKPYYKEVFSIEDLEGTNISDTTKVKKFLRKMNGLGVVYNIYIPERNIILKINYRYSPQLRLLLKNSETLEIDKN